MAKTWQVVLATIAIFVAGLVTGGATALGVAKWVARHPRANQTGNPFTLFGRNGQPLQMGPQLMRSFENRLDLTDEQRSRIGPIVKRTVAQLGRERREIQLTSALAIEKMQDDIADVLTPLQRSKFEELIAQQRSRLQQFRQLQQQAQQAPPQGAAQPPK
jgi:Spy/CpxP family protein refolding chaperone